MRLLVLCIALLVAASPAPATGQASDRPGVSDQDRSRGHRMLRKLRETLDRYYYDSTYHGINLDRHLAQTDSSIDRAATRSELLAAIANFLYVLDDSHTRFYPPDNPIRVNYGWSSIIIGEDCYVASVREKSDAAVKGLQVGDRILAIDAIQPTRASMRLIGYVYHNLSPRPGMRLLAQRVDGSRVEMIVDAEITRVAAVRDSADLEAKRRGLEELERSRPRHGWREIDSVFVWRLPSFMPRDPQIDRLMERARRHRWLILDLRGNGGGAIEALLRLLGHFFPEPFDAYTEVWRDSTVAQRVVPRGDRPYSGEVIVVVDSRSASASELAGRVLQMRGRATVVGDRSMGAVQTSYYINLDLGSAYFQERHVDFGMSVTINDVVMPDSSRLEKVGVTPNVAALPTGADLAAKRDPAMQFALEMAGVKMTAEEAGKLLSR